MFRPNQNCTVYKNIVNDVYGHPSLSGAIRERCTVTTTVLSVKKSAVRADTSATRGNAREMDIDSTVLLTKKTCAVVGDVLEVDGFKMLINSMIRRDTLLGVTDHYEATGSYWSK